MIRTRKLTPADTFTGKPVRTARRIFKRHFTISTEELARMTPREHEEAAIQFARACHVLERYGSEAEKFAVAAIGEAAPCGITYDAAGRAA